MGYLLFASFHSGIDGPNTGLPADQGCMAKKRMEFVLLEARVSH